MTMPQQAATPVIIAITGASGAAYGLRLIQQLANKHTIQHVLLSDAARVVLKQELDLELPDTPAECGNHLAQHLDISTKALHCYGLTDWFSPTASGSAGIKRMVVIPCSMGSLSRIATGASDNLIERAADVMLKERRQLILVPREMPLSSIHLENMLKLSHAGAHIVPAMPGFYHRPESVDDMIDFVVERVIDQLDFDNRGAKRWGN